MKHLWFIFILLAASGSIAATEPVRFEDPAKTRLYEYLLEEIRCLVCQNQSLADSNAELAQDLRSEIVAMIRAGKNEKDIKAFLVERYGDFVLYRPPLQENTWLLWVGPFVFLLAGIIVVIIMVKRQSGTKAATVELTAEQQQAVKQLDNETS